MVLKAESLKRQVERKRLEALLEHLSALDGKRYRILKWAEDEERNKKVPEIIFIDQNDGPCGAIELKESAEYGEEDFHFEATFPDFKRDLEDCMATELQERDEAYALYVPRPSPLPKKGSKEWQELVSCLQRAMSLLRKAYGEYDQFRWLFQFQGEEYDLSLEPDSRPGLFVVDNRGPGQVPDAQALEKTVADIASKNGGASGLPLIGLINVLSWLGSEYVNPEQLADDLRPRYPQIERLFLIEFAGEPSHLGWSRVGDYELLKIW